MGLAEAFVKAEDCIGDGSGYGDGYGSGSGDGYGYGYGDGSGYGYGYGDGSGYGYGSKDYLEAVLNAAAGKRGEEVRAEGAVLSFWKSNPDGTPSNGGGGGPRKPGFVEEIPGPLAVCTKNALHATFHPPKWAGGKLWVVAMYPPFQTNEDKLGALKREIICEIPNFFE